MDVELEKLSELVTKYQHGESDTFDQIYNMTYSNVYFTAIRICKNKNDAEDILQETYIYFMKKSSEIKNPDLFINWLNKVVVNKSKNLLRKNNPSLFKDDDEERFLLDYIQDEDTEFNPALNLNNIELQEEIIELVDRLSDEKRMAVMLYYYNEMTTREIAESLGVNENTIKSRLVQAKKDLAKGIKDLEKKNKTLFGITPVSAVVWALKNSAKSSGEAFAKSGGATAALSAINATSTGIGIAASTGLATKIIASVVLAGIVAGGVAGTKAIKSHEEETTVAVIEEYTEMTESDKREELITSRPVEEYTVADDKLADTYFEKGTLKYGVDYTIQRYANKNGSVYSGRPVLNRKNFNASYEELLPAAKENRVTYDTYISNSFSEINKKRIEEGKDTLNLDDTLTEQANVRAEEIAWTERDTAIRFDGTSYITLFEQNGYNSGSRDEIRRVDYSSYDTAISSIIKDEKIIGDFEKIGIGISKNPENEKLVFVIHLYSSENGKSDERVSEYDKFISWQNDMIDNVQNRLLDDSKIDDFESKGKKLPIIKDILEYDFHNDLIFEYIEKIIVYISDFAERIGE